MRFFHLSDLHIGRQLYQYSLIEDQRYILEQILEMVRQYRPDAVVIAGDVYDKPVPSAEAVALWDQFLTELAEMKKGPEILITAGNHDSAERLNYGAALLSKLRIHIAALPPARGEYLKKIRFNDQYGPVDFYLMPFIKPPYIRSLFEAGKEPKTYDEAVRALVEREKMEADARKVIVSHQFFVSDGAAAATCDSELLQVGGLDQVNIEIFGGFEYAALGHLHGKQRVGHEKFRYCGSPLKYSVSECSHEKTVTMVELKEAGKNPDITELPLIPMRELRAVRGTLEEVLQMAQKGIKDDYVSVTLTDEQEQTDARDRLADVYSHLLEVQVDNARTRQQLDAHFETDIFLSPEEIFANFFEGIQGRPLTDEEWKIAVGAIDRSKMQTAGLERKSDESGAGRSKEEEQS